MKKSELRKIIKEVISENQSQILSEQGSLISPQLGQEHPDSVYLFCPHGYEFQTRNLSFSITPAGYVHSYQPAGGPGDMDREVLRVSKCVPMRTIPDTSPVKPSRPETSPVKPIRESKKRR